MHGSQVLLLLIIISSLPVIAVYVWFRKAKYNFSLIRFLFALLAGAAAFFPALILQDILLLLTIPHGRAALLFEYFIRIAFTEELSRLLMLLVFFLISGIIVRESAAGYNQNTAQPLTFNAVKKGTATGLIAGLGFSILENASYAASGLSAGIILLRVFTAALHGACGSRIGAAAVLFRVNPFQALLRILIATAIHGVFNFMITIPGLFPSIAAYIIAVSALITAILTIHVSKAKETPPEASV
jgi:RsiW-degrading membrane proteinase PrsW (M82 family)